MDSVAPYSGKRFGLKRVMLCGSNRLNETSLYAEIKGHNSGPHLFASPVPPALPPRPMPQREEPEGEYSMTSPLKRKCLGASDGAVVTPSVPELDVSMPSQASSKKVYSHCRTSGHLQLSATVLNGLLTVHVVQARHLSAASATGRISSFVQVSLEPEGVDRTCAATDVISDSLSPVFDEKFTFELLPQDRRKRLYLAVYNRQGNEEQNSLLGSMSFGIKNLMTSRKTVQGWYYLLAEEFGQRKHLQVMQRDEENMAPNSGRRDGVSYTVSLNRCVLSGGFGFTVKGSCPVRIGRIDPGSSASACSRISEGDVILRVNGQNVTMTTAENVARMIKHCPAELTLSLQQGHNTSSLYKSVGSAASRKSQRSALSPIQDDDLMRKRRAMMTTNKESFSSPHVENEAFVDTVPVNASIPQRSLWDLWSPIRDSRTRTPCHSEVFVTPCLSLKRRAELDDASDIEEDFDEDLNDAHIHDSALAESMKSSPQAKRQTAVEELLRAEELFVTQMQRGVQRFSRPLRHHILTALEHSTLFQNLEKIVAISEFHVRQLRVTNLGAADLDRNEDRFLDTVGGVYSSKIPLLVEAYETYSRGLGAAESLLNELRGCKDFNNFVAKPAQLHDELNIDEFIVRPVEHLRELIDSLQAVLDVTTDQHPDYQDLDDVIHSLNKSLELILNGSGSNTSGISSGVHRRNLSASFMSVATSAGFSDFSSMHNCVD